jgi:hypothetical protein
MVEQQSLVVGALDGFGRVKDASLWRRQPKDVIMGATVALLEQLWHCRHFEERLASLVLS